MMYAVSKGVYYVQVGTQKEPCITITYHAVTGGLRRQMFVEVIYLSSCLIKCFTSSEHSLLVLSIVFVVLDSLNLFL